MTQDYAVIVPLIANLVSLFISVTAPAAANL
jgi:hypothetical protein